MKNKELIVELSDRLAWPEADVAEMLSALVSIIGIRLVENDGIYLQSLGLFEVKKKAERISVNPTSGKRYLVPPKLVPVFKPGNTLKNKLKELTSNE
ncbi:MAG: HU family DNA-binding protein [Tannerellaceae bacterium]